MAINRTTGTFVSVSGFSSFFPFIFIGTYCVPATIVGTVKHISEQNKVLSLISVNKGFPLPPEKDFSVSLAIPFK